MHKAEIEILTKNGRKLYTKMHFAPSNWQEVTRADLFVLAKTLSAQNIAIQIAKHLLAITLYAIPQYILKFIPESRLYNLTHSIQFLTEKNELQNWLIPYIWFGFRKYYGPKKRISNLTVEEFTLCEFCYEQLAIEARLEKKQEYLNTLVAILYRPYRWFNILDDVRANLTTNGYEKRAAQFSTLPSVTKWAIYLNYEGCRNFLIKRHPEVFKKGEQSGAPSSKITPWSKIVESAAGGKFGTLQTTEKVNIYKFLSELSERIKEARELKAS